MNKFFISLFIFSLTIVSCKHEPKKKTWTQEQKDSVYEGCVTSSGRGDDPQVQAYCHCLLENFVEHFPNPDSIQNADSADMAAVIQNCITPPAEYDTATPVQVKKINQSIKNQWGKKDRDNFLESCVDDNKTRNKMSYSDAINACSCSLEKIMESYPVPDSAKNITDRELMEIKNACVTK